MLGAKPKLTPNQQKQKQADQSMDGAARRVAQGSEDPLDLKAARLAKTNLRKAMQLKKNPPKESATLKNKGKVLEAEDEFVPRQGPETGGEFEPTTPDSLAQGEEPPAEIEPLTTEGETFYVNLARKSLFVDLDNADLNDAERQAITQDVRPENAKEIAKILRKVVSDYGLGESFNTRIDSLIEGFELADLQSKISIEDLKKNDRVVVLVPGSFKPPHRGHYEMVKQYSEAHPQGQVQVIISAPSASSERRTLNGKGPVITPAAAEEIFKEYIRVGGLSNVAVFVSPHPSPVTAAYETMERLSEDRPGITIILGASKKDNDWKRWKTAPDWAVKNNLDLDIWSPEETAVDVCIDAECRPYSASNIRDNFNDWEKIKDDIPIGVDPKFVKNVFNSL